ncbi:uncharacterized protein LOC131595058 [Vicia villosa]|uniref:uncharacterized protein LOC131595058 n=1 Tax=Vicia villosa TaxID=3911 RepID=UPI00273CA4C1|nr:uncharacterized protein LOC131595058 [Vicia villosa]
MACVSTVSYKFAINGEPSVSINAKRGLRQGDPISPLLFVLIMEYMHRVLQGLEDEPAFKFHPKCAKMSMLNVCFADDILLFSRADTNSIRLIMGKIREFSQTTGLHMSAAKSKIYFGGVNSACQEQLQLETGFQIGVMPFKYLGVPLDSKKLTVLNCQPLIEKMLCKFKHWNTRMLSYAGRLQLIKIAITSIANYWLHIFPLPKKILKHVESLCRSFLWTGQETVSNRAPISWDHICDPVAAGGLNITDLGVWNRASIGKMLWNLHTKKDRMWINWVHHFYMKNHDVMNFVPKPTASWIIKAMFKHRDTLCNSDAWNNFAGTGIYRTRMIYSELRGIRPDVPWKNMIRGNLESPRAVFSLWMACHCRLNTKDRILKIGVHTDGVCVFCGAMETCDHLFFDCAVTKVLWQQILFWLKLNHVPQEWSREVRWISEHTKGSSKSARILKMCIVEAVYHVWIQRNRKVFNGPKEENLLAQDILYRVKGRVAHNNKLKLFVDALG